MIERLRVRVPAESAGEYSCVQLTLCADSYSVSVLPRFTSVARKGPGHSVKSADGRIHPKHAHTLNLIGRSWLTMLSRHSVGIYEGNGHTHGSSENSRPQSSQLAKPLWTDPGLKSGIGMHELIPIKKEKERKKA